MITVPLHLDQVTVKCIGHNEAGFDFLSIRERRTAFQQELITVRLRNGLRQFHGAPSGTAVLSHPGLL